MDYITLGPAPAEEDCAQVGEPDYYTRAHEECRRYRNLIRRVLGAEPDGAQLTVTGFNHDFGHYYEVTVEYDPDNPAAVEYAFRCEAKAPGRWDE